MDWICHGAGFEQRTIRSIDSVLAKRGAITHLSAVDGKEHPTHLIDPGAEASVAVVQVGGTIRLNWIERD